MTIPDTERGRVRITGIEAMQLRGHPRKVASNGRSRDPATARRLWELSEELTGVRYDALA